MTDEPNHLPVQQLVDGFPGTQFELFAKRTLEVDVGIHVHWAGSDGNAGLVLGRAARHWHFECLLLSHGLMLRAADRANLGPAVQAARQWFGLARRDGRRLAAF